MRLVHDCKWQSKGKQMRKTRNRKFSGGFLVTNIIGWPFFGFDWIVGFPNWKFWFDLLFDVGVVVIVDGCHCELRPLLGPVLNPRLNIRVQTSRASAALQRCQNVHILFVLFLSVHWPQRNALPQHHSSLLWPGGQMDIHLVILFGSPSMSTVVYCCQFNYILDLL